MFYSLLLGLILNFLFNSLIWNIICFSLISNFRMIFNLMINNLILCNIFINRNSNFFLNFIILCYYLFIRYIFKTTFAFDNLTVLWLYLSTLKQYCLFYWFYLGLNSCYNTFYYNWLSLDWCWANTLVFHILRNYLICLCLYWYLLGRKIL